jgi:hypothetical protein
VVSERFADQIFALAFAECWKAADFKVNAELIDVDRRRTRALSFSALAQEDEVFSKKPRLVLKILSVTVCGLLSVTPAAAVKSVNAIPIDGVPINGKTIRDIVVNETHVTGPRVASTPIRQMPVNQANLSGKGINGVSFNAMSNKWTFDHWRVKRAEDFEIHKPIAQ